MKETTQKESFQNLLPVLLFLLQLHQVEAAGSVNEHYPWSPVN
jgi:hypothetical protein